MPHSISFNMSAESSLEYFNITTRLHPIYFFVSLDASAWTFLRSVCGSVRAAAMCSRTLSANAPFIGSLLDFTPSIAQIYSVQIKLKLLKLQNKRQLKFYQKHGCAEVKVAESPGMKVNDCTSPRSRSNRQSPTGPRGAWQINKYSHYLQDNHTISGIHCCRLMTNRELRHGHKQNNRHSQK